MTCIERSEVPYSSSSRVPTRAAEPTTMAGLQPSAWLSGAASSVKAKSE